jgi:cyclic pyranopterin phosphate synthase
VPHVFVSLHFGKVLNKVLEDKFGRRFHYLWLSITDVCNVKCNDRLPDRLLESYACDVERDFLVLSEIKTLINGFASLVTSNTCITGGEPSPRKDLSDIIKACLFASGIKHVAMTSNGNKLEADIQKWVDAGLDSLNISVDSPDPQIFSTITGHNRPEIILHSIDKALALGVKVKINAVSMKQYNVQELQHFLTCLKATPVTLRLIELMQTGDNVRFFEQNYASGTPIKGQLLENGWNQLIRDNASRLTQEFLHPDYQGRAGLSMPYSQNFCATCHLLRISVTGKLHLCLFAKQGLAIRPTLQPADSKGLQANPVDLLSAKEATHRLQYKYSGATKHLAMLSG